MDSTVAAINLTRFIVNSFICFGYCYDRKLAGS